jgi:hypothetical protein
MAIDGKSKIAIAASILWMAMATFVILGTHGETVAKADASVPAVGTETEWMAHPAELPFELATVQVTSRC